jgi:sarcosine oxidase, subunit beta
MAPAMAELYADWLTGRGKHELFDRFSLARFDRVDGAVREDFIIG